MGENEWCGGGSVKRSVEEMDGFFATSRGGGRGKVVGAGTSDERELCVCWERNWRVALGDGMCIYSNVCTVQPGGGLVSIKHTVIVELKQRAAQPITTAETRQPRMPFNSRTRSTRGHT